MLTDYIWGCMLLCELFLPYESPSEENKSRIECVFIKYARAMDVFCFVFRLLFSNNNYVIDCKLLNVSRRLINNVGSDLFSF